MTTPTTSMHETTPTSSHVMTETPTSTSRSMVEPSTTINDPTSSSRAGSSSMHTTVPPPTQNTPSTSTRPPSESTSTRPPPESSSTPSTSAPNTTILRTTPTTTPESSTPLPTTPLTSDATSIPPSSSSDAPSTPSGSTTSITSPAPSFRPSFETTPVSSTPDPTPSSSASSDPPVSETPTNTLASTTPPAASSTPPGTTSTPAESETSTAPNAVVTSGSVIFSSASDVQVSFTTTNSLGQTTVGIPPVFTTTYTSTSNGVPLTITAVVSQATTLNTDGGGSTSPFFKNKGAVAGVFIVVGIAGAAIILFGVFTFLRRRKMNRLTREAAIAATLGSGRTPFVDDDDAYGSGPSGGNSTEMGYHSASDTRPVYGGYGAAYGAAGSTYGYGPDPFYGNPPAGKSFNASPPGSMDHHGPIATNPQGLLPPNSYGTTGGPNLPPPTPLLANGNQVTVPPAVAPASPPSVYSNVNAPKGYEYDYSNYVPPSALDGPAGRTLSPSPTSPTFSKRSSLPAPPPGAAPSYAALAIAAGLVSDPNGPPATHIPPSAYQGPASSKVRRTSNTPSFASSASRYSVDSPAVEIGAGRPQPPGLPTYSVANVSKSQSGHSFNASSSNQSHGRPPTPGAEALLTGDRGRLIRSASGGSDWKADQPETPLIDHRLDPDTILAAKGRSPANGNRLSDYSTPSEESLGSLQDHEDYSRRVLQVTNPS
ncbi:hypothetical protein FS837_002791 [Tulasnella sp. UAMH 9824]|nr:hypothetical protein FS837_002791 [Tulasnella sp. UAMH 9824]